VTIQPPAPTPPLSGDDLFHTLRRLADEVRSVLLPPTAPRVIIVPGLPGTTLGTPAFPVDDVVWFDPLGAFRGRLLELAVEPTSPPLSALGTLDAGYLQLTLRLRRAGYDVEVHPFDWRLSLDQLGVELARRIAAREGEVHLVAHSFGGLVARAALVAGAPRVGKVILLGTPNHGTFAPVQGIRGTHWLIRVLSALDAEHTPHQLAERVFASFPSVYEQLPTRRVFAGFDLYDPASWPGGGCLPRPGLLQRAPAIQERLTTARGRFVVIAGTGVPTIDHVEARGGVFRYQGSTGGDGWVPARFAVLDDAPRYFVHASHLGMTNHGAVIDAVEDLLAGDATGRLPASAPPGTPVPDQSDADLPLPPFGGRKGSGLTAADLEALIEQLRGV
jgi:pimeloyl-ACP methyl ester carboxylesterase